MYLPTSVCIDSGERGESRSDKVCRISRAARPFVRSALPIGRQRRKGRLRQGAARPGKVLYTAGVACWGKSEYRNRLRTPQRQKPIEMEATRRPTTAPRAWLRRDRCTKHPFRSNAQRQESTSGGVYVQNCTPPTLAHPRVSHIGISPTAPTRDFSLTRQAHQGRWRACALVSVDLMQVIRR
jgi:hypothetical protein